LEGKNYPPLDFEFSKYFYKLFCIGKEPKSGTRKRGPSVGGPQRGNQYLGALAVNPRFRTPGNLSDVQEVVMVETVGVLRAVLGAIAVLKLHRVVDAANTLCRTTPDGSGHAADADGLFRFGGGV